MVAFFGRETFQVDENIVDPELKECFSNVIPSNE